MDYHCWNLLKFFFIESGEAINADTLKDLLGLVDPDTNLYGQIAKQEANKPAQSLILRHILYGKEAFAKQREEATPEVINTHIRRILQEIKKVHANIEANVPLDQGEGIRLEYICYVVRMTIMQDKWYENKESTRKRGCYTSLLYIVFLLELSYRLWGRKNLIMEEGEYQTVGPIFSTREEFVADGWFTVPLIKEPIKQWNAAQVTKSLNWLLRSRPQGKTDLYTMSAIYMFRDYRNGLFDRVAELVVLSVPGTPDQIAGEHGSEWYRMRSEANLEVIDMDNNGGVKAINKEIYKHQQDELIKKQKELQIQGSAVKETVYSKEVRWTKMKQLSKHEKELKRLNNELFRCQTQLKLLKEEPSEEEANAYDSELAFSLTVTIEHIKRELEALEAKYVKSEQENAAKRLEEATQLASTKKNTLYDSDARLSFIRYIMVYYDHVKSWQFPVGARCQVHDVKHLKLREILRDEIIESLRLTSEAQFLHTCQQWIVSRVVGFLDREIFRQNYSEDYQFTNLDVWAHRLKDNTEFEEKNEQNKDPFKDFPTDLTVLIQDEDNPYYQQAWAYFVWWYLLQKFPECQIDAAAYYWDYEEAYLSLQRVPHKNPVMTKIGSEWFCANKGQWRTGDKLNGYFCGESALDCFTCWLFQMGETGMDLTDRFSGITWSLKHNTLKYLLQQVVPPLETDPELPGQLDPGVASPSQ